MKNKDKISPILTERQDNYTSRRSLDSNPSWSNKSTERPTKTPKLFKFHRNKNLVTKQVQKHNEEIEVLNN